MIWRYLWTFSSMTEDVRMEYMCVYTPITGYGDNMGRIYTYKRLQTPTNNCTINTHVIILGTNSMKKRRSGGREGVF